MISVIIPVYNVEKYLDQCIQSVINQSYTDFECILINDGSTDNSGEICNKWSEIDNRIKVIHQKNQGVSVARNRGIEIANGEYIYFIDGDDICCLNIFNDVTTHDLYLGEYEIVSNSTFKIKKNHIYCDEDNNTALNFLKENIKACVGSFIVSKKVLTENNITFNSKYKYGEDLEFILKIILSSNSISIKYKPYVKYIQHLGSTMKKISLDRYDVFFSRLNLIDYAKLKLNYNVAEYIQDYSCIESIIEVTTLLLIHKFPIKQIKQFFANNPIIYDVLNRNTQQKYYYHSIILKRNIYIFSSFIKIKTFFNIIQSKIAFIK